MTEMVTLSKADLQEMLAQVAAGQTPAANLAAPLKVTPEMSIPDVLRMLVNNARIPEEATVRAAQVAIDKWSDELENKVTTDTGTVNV